MSPEQFARLCIAKTVTKRANNPMFADISTYQGDALSDLAEKHDDYLYGEDS